MELTYKKLLVFCWTINELPKEVNDQLGEWLDECTLFALDVMHHFDIDN